MMTHFRSHAALQMTITYTNHLHLFDELQATRLIVATVISEAQCISSAHQKALDLEPWRLDGLVAARYVNKLLVLPCL